MQARGRVEAPLGIGFTPGSNDVYYASRLRFHPQLNVVDERGGKGNSHLDTAGGQVFGKTPGRFDYSAEVMRQWGYLASDQIAAMAGAYTIGWKPRLSFEID